MFHNNCIYLGLTGESLNSLILFPKIKITYLEVHHVYTLSCAGGFS